MRNAHKRLLSGLVILAMTLTLLPLSSVSAQVTVTKDGPSYQASLADWVIAPSASGTTCGLPGGADADIAAPGYSTSGWLATKAPGTVLGNLIDDHVYDSLFDPDNSGNKDVFFSSNLAKIPPADFSSAWWYSTTFTVPTSENGKKVNIKFKGVAFSADVYVNGHKLSNDNIDITDEQFLQDGPPVTGAYANPAASAVSSTVGALGLNPAFDSYKNLFMGTFRTYDLDITPYLNANGSPNNIKLKITKPVYKNDLTAYWVDWDPQPADNMMGITGDVILSTSGAVRLDNPAVSSSVSDDLTRAGLNLYCDVSNPTGANVLGELNAVISDPDGKTVAVATEHNINVPAGTYNQEVRMAASDFLALNLNNPQLWWPYMSGGQPLYSVSFTFTNANTGTVTDSLKQRFGIRQIDAEINVSPTANSNAATVSLSSGANMIQVYVNHKPVVLKGGGYCPTDLFYRHSDWQNRAVVDYLKYMGMNMIRDEGKFYDDNLMDLFDENGIVVLTGWCCCDRWQSPQSWSKAERFVAYESLYSQLKSLRSHPSMILWFNGSDQPASNNGSTSAKMVEEKYIEIEAMLRWNELGLFAASACLDTSALLGGINTGFHMDASYDNQTPTYYYNPAITLGLFGFTSEGGGGAAIPPIEAMKRMLPTANLWPYNTGANYNVWNWHTSRGGFSTLSQLGTFIDGTYGASGSLEEWNARAQAYVYDMQRAQYESLNMMRYTDKTGFVNWMLNDAWPGMYWNQFDAYMNPNGATFGVRKANEPVHIMYDMFDKKVDVINSTFDAYPGMTATMSVYDIKGNLISTPLTKTLDVAADGASAAAPYGTMAITPKRNGSSYDAATKTFTDVSYNYNGQITRAYGVNELWNSDDIQKSLTAPTSDVYFIRLELKDAGGNVVSYNSYAEPMRNDVTQYGSWNRSPALQVPDLTELNALPPVNLDTSVTSAPASGGKLIQTLNVKNNTTSIAYAVNISAYTDASKTKLVAPVLYSDNLFTLFPGETRTITVSHNVSDLAGDAVIAVTCYNNQIQNKPDPARVRDIYKAVPAGGSRNLAINAPVTGSGGGTPANLTAVTPAVVNQAAAGKTFIDSNMNTIYSPTAIGAGSGASAWYTVDLGAPKPFDRIMLRWNGSSGNLRGRPDKVLVEGSDDNAAWTAIANYDNTNSGSVMTNIILPQQVTYQYVKVTPMGLAAAAPAISAAAGLSGTINAAAAPTAFNCSAIEIYAYQNCVNLSIVGDGSVTCNGNTYDMSMTANQRVIPADSTGSAQFTFNPVVPDASIKVVRDGVDITNQVNLAANSLTLTGINADTNVVVYYGPPVQYATSITIYADPTITFKKGTTMRLYVIPHPDGTAVRDVTWTSNIPNVCSIDQNGVVTGLKTGTVRITATTSDGLVAMTLLMVTA